MEAVTLGMTDVRVSRIAYGAWGLGGEWASFDENGATATIRHARERGITLFDTAQTYGFGASERILGRAMTARMSSIVGSARLPANRASRRSSSVTRRVR